MKNEALDLIARWVIWVTFIYLVADAVNDLTSTWADWAGGSVTGLAVIVSGALFAKVFWLWRYEDDKADVDEQVPVA